MAEDVALKILADIRAYQKDVAKIPGVTEKQAAKAALAMQKEFVKAQTESAKAAKKAAKESTQAWGGVGDFIKAQLSVDAFKAAGSAVLGYVGEVNALRVEMALLESTVGLNADTMAGVSLAVRKSGGDFSAVAGGVADFGEVLFDFANGGGRAKEALELLGFEAETMGGRLDDVDGVFREVIQGMQGTEKGAQRNAIAQQLFSDAGLDLAHALGEVPLEAFTAQAEHFGLDVGPEAAQAAREFNSAVADMRGVFDKAFSGLSDRLPLTEAIEGFTVGFIFSTVAMSTALTEFGEAAVRVFGIYKKAAELDLVGAMELAQEHITTTTGAFSRIDEAATGSARAFFDLREETKKAAAATDSQRRGLESLSEAIKKAEKEAKDRAAAMAKRDAAQLKIQGTLSAVILKANADQLSASDQIILARDRELGKLEDLEEKLDDLAEKGADVSRDLGTAELARLEVVDKAERDLEKLRDEDHQKHLDQVAELQEFADETLAAGRAAEEKAAEDRLEQFHDAIDAVGELGDLTLGTLEEVFKRQTRAATDAFDAAKSTVQGIKDERADLTAQLLDEENEVKRARIEARLAELDADLRGAKLSRKARKENVMKAHRAEKALALSGVAFNTAVAVLKAYSQFGPPPSPVGIAASAAAVATGAVQAALVATQKPPQFHAGGSELLGGISPSFTRGPDEITVTRPEAVLNARAASNLGRQQIDEMNRTGGGGGRNVVELNFESRHIDTMVAATLSRGGRARQLVNSIARTRPVGQIPVFGV